MDSCKKLLKLEFIQLSRESFGSSSHVLTHGILPSHGVLHLEYRIEFEKQNVWELWEKGPTKTLFVIGSIILTLSL